MYQLIKPRFKFTLYIIKNQKDIQPLVCFAEAYDIKEDGSIIFYQIGKTSEDKKIKIPVLAYPNGKWDSCILMNNDNFPVFDNSSTENIVINKSKNEVSNSIIPAETNSKIELKKEDDFDDLDMFANEQTESPFPSIVENNNPQEFKRLKTDWLEKLIQDFTKNSDFSLEAFSSFIIKDTHFQTFKPNETDIVWTAAKLIGDKMVLPRKFSNLILQKQLALILPGIMKRQWDGKMHPILDVLQEREETKTATAIDLAVWMAQNHWN
jgi:hypothetical protein